jgi:hypothetical protein
VTFPVAGVDPEEVGEVLKQLAPMLRTAGAGPPQLRRLLPMAISHVVDGGQVEMTTDLCGMLVKPLAEQLSRAKPDDGHTVHLLWALGSVCAGNGAKCAKFSPELLAQQSGVLLPYVRGEAGSAEAHGAAVYCVGELGTKSTERKKDR